MVDVRVGVAGRGQVGLPTEVELEARKTSALPLQRYPTTGRSSRTPRTRRALSSSAADTWCGVRGAADWPNEPVKVLDKAINLNLTGETWCNAMPQN